MLKPQTKCAFSLIESAIVLALVGLVIGGIWVAAASVSRNMKDARIVEQLLQISGNIHSLYGERLPASDLDLTSETGLLTSIIPPDMPLVGGLPQTPYGGGLVIILNSNAIAFLMLSLSVDDCARLGTKIIGVLQAHRAYGGTLNESLDLGDIETSTTACQHEYDLNGSAGFFIALPY